MGSENGQEAIESGAVFLFKTFYMKEHVGHDEAKAIKQMFGPFPPSSATAACCATCRIASCFPEEQLTTLLQMGEEQNEDSTLYFGKNIVFSFDMHDLDLFEELSVNGETEEPKELSLDYNKFLNSRIDLFSNCCEENSGMRSLEQVDDSFLWCEVGKYLNESLKETPGGPTIEHLCCTLYEMLASHKTGDELQNEVGWMYILFIQLILHNYQCSFFKGCSPKLTYKQALLNKVGIVFKMMFIALHGGKSLFQMVHMENSMWKALEVRIC